MSATKWSYVYVETFITAFAKLFGVKSTSVGMSHIPRLLCTPKLLELLYRLHPIHPPLHTLYTPFTHPLHTLYTPYNTPYTQPIHTLYTPIRTLYTLYIPYNTPYTHPIHTPRDAQRCKQLWYNKAASPTPT